MVYPAPINRQPLSIINEIAKKPEGRYAVSFKKGNPRFEEVNLVKHLWITLKQFFIPHHCRRFTGKVLKATYLNILEQAASKGQITPQNIETVFKAAQAVGILPKKLKNISDFKTPEQLYLSEIASEVFEGVKRSEKSYSTVLKNYTPYIENHLSEKIRRVFGFSEKSQKIESPLDIEVVKVEADLAKQVIHASPSEIPPSLSNEQVYTKETFEVIRDLITKDQELPGEKSAKMTAEEHMLAILYETLGERPECVLLTFYNDTLPQNFDLARLHPKNRYLLIPLSVNHNTHNTALAIDREKQTYTYFDSSGGRKVPEKIRLVCKEKGLNLKEKGSPEKEGFNLEERVQTRQKDGWSCGFHVVENLIAYVNDRPPREFGSGEELRNNYVDTFKAFATTHGRSISEREQRELNINNITILINSLISLIFAIDENEEIKSQLIDLHDKLNDPELEGKSLKEIKTKFENQYSSSSLFIKILNEAIAGKIHQQLQGKLGDLQNYEEPVEKIIKDLCQLE